MHQRHQVEVDTDVVCPNPESSIDLELLSFVQVLESASRSSLWSDADEDALEAMSMLIKGMDETCSSECSISQHQVCTSPNTCSVLAAVSSVLMC